MERVLKLTGHNISIKMGHVFLAAMLLGILTLYVKTTRVHSKLRRPLLYPHQPHSL